MSNKEKAVEKTGKVEKVEKVDYKVKWEEARENLLIQLKESLEQIELHTTRATKIRGVVEVNDQMFLEENEEN